MTNNKAKAPTPVWFLENEDGKKTGPLEKDARTDICIVGAGIAGLATAYELAKAGKKVVVLESRIPGAGETGNTTAHLANALDDRFANLESLFGKEGSRLAAESHGAAIDRIETVVNDEAIDCDFERLNGYLFLAEGHKRDLLEQELQAAHRAGLRDVALLPRTPLSFDAGPCLCFPKQGQFHPVRYLHGLMKAVKDLGGKIYSDTHVEEIKGGKQATVKIRAGYTVTAEAVVVATNTPVNDMFAMHTKQYPYRTYALAFRVPIREIPKGLYWDTADAYHYVRLQTHNQEEEFLIVGGEDHKTGQNADPEDCYHRLKAWTRKRFPQAQTVATSWSGQVWEPMDYLGYIGRNPGDEDNVYIVTGDSGHGMTHGTIAGMLLTDLILGRKNPWAELYDPARKSVRMAGTFLRENLNVAAQYLDWILPGSLGSVDDIKPGEGVIVQNGLSKLAVSRDDSGNLQQMSATCPHLGCVVQWNKAEKSWDCPCHGSRFSCDGKVINGPANADLEPVEGTKKTTAAK